MQLTKKKLKIINILDFMKFKRILYLELTIK